MDPLSKTTEKCSGTDGKLPIQVYKSCVKENQTIVRLKNHPACKKEGGGVGLITFFSLEKGGGLLREGA